MMSKGAEIALQNDNPNLVNVREANKKFKEKTGIRHIPGIGEHWAVNGRTGSGKSSAVKAMIVSYYRELFDDIFVLASTVKGDCWEQCGIPESNLIETVTERKFNQLYEQAFEKFEYSEKGAHNWFTLFIIDDGGSKTRGWRGIRYGKDKDRGPSFSDLLIKARHGGVSIHILSQDPMMIDGPTRANIHAHSFAEHFTELNELERAAKGKGIPVSRKPTTPDDVKTLNECMAEVRKVNAANGNTYGRLFYSAVNGERPDFFFQFADQFAELEPEKIYNRGRRGRRGYRGAPDYSSDEDV